MPCTYRIRSFRKIQWKRKSESEKEQPVNTFFCLRADLHWQNAKLSELLSIRSRLRLLL